MKNKVDKFDVYKLVYLPVDLSKLSDVVKMMLLKKMHIMLRLKLLKIKYMILLTYPPGKETLWWRRTDVS